MTDLKTKYLGLDLKNPLVASASALSKKVSKVKMIEDAGISAVVMYSLFEEQITHDSLAFNYYMERGTERFAESLDYFPNLDRYNVGPDEYLEKIRQYKDAVDIPIIASLNGVSNSGWVEYAQKMAQAGADAIELNTYYIPASPEISAAEVEDNTVELVKAVYSHVDIPVSVKLSPFFTALPQLADRLVAAGAQGLVLFNRFIQPDIDIEKEVFHYPWELSNPKDRMLGLRYAGLLHGNLDGSICVSRGIYDANDVIKMILAGADTVQMVSTIYRNQPAVVTDILIEMNRWMDDKGYKTLNDFRGKLSRKNMKDPYSYQRAQYVDILMKSDTIFKKYPMV